MQQFVKWDNISSTVVYGPQSPPAGGIEDGWYPCIVFADIPENHTMVYDLLEEYSVVIQRAVPLPTSGASFDKLQITADGVDVAILSPLPIPSTVIVNGAQQEIIDGSLEVVSILDGTYNIIFSTPGYATQEWTIEAI